MPSYKISLDFSSRKLSDASSGLLSVMTGKKNSIIYSELSIVQGVTVISLPSGSTVEVGMKKTADPAGALIFHTTATRSGWGTGSRWFYTLDLSSNAFSTLVGTTLDFEIMIQLPPTTANPLGQQVPSDTVPFTIVKNVMV